MKTFTCECGCGKVGSIKNRTFVRKTDGPPRPHRGQFFRRALSWQVLRECAKPFMLELRASQRCLATAQALTCLPRWRRIPRIPKLWQLRRLSLQRRLGDSQAKAKAWGLVITTLLCRRLVPDPQPLTFPERLARCGLAVEEAAENTADDE